MALDWPSYAAGRTRGLPWFLLAARLVAGAGHPVLLHGWNGGAAGPDPRDVLGALDIPTLAPGDAAPVGYLPLETLSPPLHRLPGLRAGLGLRPCINTIARLLDPAGAPAAVQGVFHPPHLRLQADASARLGVADVTIVKGGGGELERSPGTDVAAVGLRVGAPYAATWPGPLEPMRLGDGATDPRRLAALRSGD